MHLSCVPKGNLAH